MSSAFAAYVAGTLANERFSLVDIGCSGGIDPVWRLFGDNLRALAFDASIDECERLAAQETFPDVHYIGGYVGIPETHPFKLAADAANLPLYNRNIFPRTSAGRLFDMKRERLAVASLSEKLHNNVWMLTKLGDPEKPVIVPDCIAEAGWSDVDFLKVDIDGYDYQVLNSFDGLFDSLGILALRAEVNFYGGPHPTEHVFHNTDRFLRERGFELLALDVRTYSMSALPLPFAIGAPAQTTGGRPFQGEAYYARDPAAPHWQGMGESMTTGKLAKLAAIMSLWNQPDSAAELILAYRSRFETVIDVELGLELLAGQAQHARPSALPFADYVAAFEADASIFYPEEA